MRHLPPGELPGEEPLCAGEDEPGAEPGRKVEATPRGSGPDEADGPLEAERAEESAPECGEGDEAHSATWLAGLPPSFR